MKIADPVCAGAGYELVDLRYVQEQGGWVVRIFIDRSGTAAVATPIGFDDCERISRELSAVFDVEDPVSHAYRLEVSSPGLDRPLRTADHFRSQLDKQAKITLSTGVDGRRNFKGTLVAVEEGDSIVAIDVDGTRYRLPVSDISTAKLVPDWDELMGAGGQGRSS